MKKLILLFLAILFYPTLGRTTNYVNIYDSATGYWTMTSYLSGGDLKADGTVPLTANWNMGAYTLTAAGFQTAKTSGIAGDVSMFEANSTDTDAAGFRGADSMTSNTSYRLKMPSAKPTSDNMAMVWSTTADSGDGTPASPYAVTGTWKDFDDYATLANPTFTGVVKSAGNSYATTSSTTTDTGNVNIDGASYADYNYTWETNSTGKTYTPVITSAPSSGYVRYVTLVFGSASTTATLTITWTNVDAIGAALGTSVTAGKKSQYACKIPSSGHARCSIVAENY